MTPGRSLLLAMLVAACAPAEEAPPLDALDTGVATEARCGGAPMTLSVGWGDDAFQPIRQGDPVTMVHGPQGGWHVEVAGFVEGLGQEVAITPRLMIPHREDLQVGGDQAPLFVALAEYDDDACSGQFSGARMLLDDVSTPPDGMTYQEFICDLDGDATLELTVEDILTGASVTESVQLHLRPDPLDECGG